MSTDWLKNKTLAVYDIETPFLTEEGLKGIKDIYCISVATIYNDKITPAKVYTNKWTPYSQGSLIEACAIINNADYRIAHNGIGFDDQVIQNVLSMVPINLPLDTLILSKIMFSKDDLFSIDASLNISKDLWSSYSLKAFGERLGDAKIEYKEFDKGLTEELTIYCNQDVNLTARLFVFLKNHVNFPIEKVIKIEHKTAEIINQQIKMGFYLDIEKANKLNATLLKEKGDLFRKLTAIFSPKWLKDGQEKKYKKVLVTKKYLPNKNYKAVW